MSELKESQNHKAFGEFMILESVNFYCDHMLKRKITKIKNQLKKNKSLHAG